jgi:hypothetical protein
MSYKYLWGFLFTLNLYGCATIQSGGRTQVVFAESDPPGAAIVVDGKEAGRTPDFVLITRGIAPYFELRTATGNKLINMDWKYRWSESFWPNFVCLSAVFGCLATDLISGAAYDAVSPGAVKLLLSPQDAKAASIKRPRIVGIAPPIAEHSEISDIGGAAIQEALVKDPGGGRVLRYDETLPEFTQYGFDFDAAPEERSPNRYKLFHELRLTSVVESVIVIKGDEYVLKATERNTYTQQPLRKFELALTPPDELENTKLKDRWWSRLLPNSVGVDYASTQLELSRGLENYVMQPSGNDEWWASGLRYLTVLDIFNMPSWRVGRSSRWLFSFVPAIRVLRNRGRITGLPTSGGGSDQEFTRWWLSGGYGIQAGWQKGRHVIYTDLIPMLHWSEISWNEHGREHSYTGTGLNMQVEIGYSYFFTANWVVTVFQRKLEENSQGWREVLRDRLGPSGPQVDATSRTTGIKVSYRFEPKLSVKNWRRR